MLVGFHVSRDWASGARPSIRAHVECAIRHRDREYADGQNLPFAFQVFLAGPRTLDFSVDKSEAADLKALMRQANAAGAPGPALWGVAHGTYMDMPWDSESKSHAYRCGFIRAEVERAFEAGLAGVVVHLGIPGPDKVVLALPWIYPGEIGGVRVCDVIAAAAKNRDGAAAAAPRHELPRIYLEVPHVLPKNSLYETPEKLAALFREVRKVDPGLDITGLCIDTAHIWACGADISSYAKGKDWVDRLAAVHDVIPPRAIIFHLNDNRNPCGSGKDEHDPLLHGKIWGDYRQAPHESGLAAFVEYARRHNIPTVLERKRRKATGDMGELTLPEALSLDYTAIVALGGE